MSTAEKPRAVSTEPATNVAGSKSWRPSAEQWKSIVAYTAGLAVCLVVTAVIHKLWKADLSVPMAYGGDAMVTHYWIKSVYDNGWYLHNDRMGAPGGSDLHDFPMADSLHFLIIRGLCNVSSNSPMAYNLFYLLTYPLIFLSSMFTLRRLGVSREVALAGSLLFSFHNYHFFRQLGHLFLGSYYVVPLSILVVVWLFQGKLSVWETEGVDKQERRARWWRLWGSLAICALQSSAGVYFAFFACYLLLLAGLSAAWRTSQWRPVWVMGLLLGVTSIGVAANTLPSTLFRIQHGRNVETAQRLHVEAEIYGLKVMQMLLPQADHRWSVLAKLRNRYDAWQQVTEASFASLGLWAGLGFVVLCAALIFRVKETDRPHIFNTLATLNLFTLLLATVGGFGALFNFLITPQIRCYNRISIFIVYFGILAVCLLAHAWGERVARAGWPRWSFGVLLGLLTTLGVYDQLPRHFKFDHARAKAPWQHDAEFFAQVEAAAPAEANILQLPYMPFPESAPIHLMYDYQHIRGLLHTSKLNWSYGTIRGREGDTWLRVLDRQALPDQLSAAVLQGFQGIYVDRLGYPDHGAELEASLQSMTDSKPIESQDTHMAYYDLRGFAKELESGLSPEQYQQRQRDTSVEVVIQKLKELK